MGSVMGRLRDRRIWAVGGLLVAALGFALGSGWLTAGALLSLLVALAPCLAMCALGLCMRRGSGQSCHGRSGADPGAATRSIHTEEPSTRQP